MDKVLIAQILKPQGLNGEIKCKLCNNNPQLLKNVNEVYLEGKDVPSRIISKRFSGGFMFVKLGTINSREKVDLLRGFGLYAERSLISVPEDEYVIDEIIGSQVVDEDNNNIGELIDVQNYGATDLFVINQYKREYMIPFVDDIVVKIVPANKLIVVNRKKYDEAKICE